MNILHLYLAATTSWTVGSGDNVRNAVALSWKPHEPVIHEITAFCQQCLGWSYPVMLMKTFEKVLWGGVIFHMFFSVSKFLHPIQKKTTSLHCLSCLSLMMTLNATSPHPTQPGVLKIAPKPCIVQSSGSSSLAYQKLVFEGPVRLQLQPLLAATSCLTYHISPTATATVADWLVTCHCRVATGSNQSQPLVL
jgi:hypothetical protein